MILLLKIKSGLNPCKIAIFQDFKPLSFPCLTFVSEMLNREIFLEKYGFIYDDRENRKISLHSLIREIVALVERIEYVMKQDTSSYCDRALLLDYKAELFLIKNDY